MIKGKWLVGYVVISIILFGLGGAFGMKIGQQAAVKRNKQLELVHFLRNMKKAANILTAEREDKTIEWIATNSVLSIIKINLDWPSYSVEYQSYVCTELAGIDKTFDIFKGKLKEASSTFIISQDVESIIDRFSQCKSNRQRNTDLDSDADAPPPVR